MKAVRDNEQYEFNIETPRSTAMKTNIPTPENNFAIS